MKLWVFDVTKDISLNDSKRYLVEQIDEDIITVHFTPTKSLTTQWAWIDEAKRMGCIQYNTTIRTLDGPGKFGMFNAKF